MDRVWREEQERLDYRAGVIAAMVANLFRGRETPAVKPEDLMPFLRKPKPPMTPETARAMLITFVQAYGGEIRE